MAPLGASRIGLMSPSGFSASGGTETTYDSGGDTYKVHTFTSTGILTVKGTGDINMLIIGGGAGGGGNSASSWHAGGGGVAEEKAVNVRGGTNVEVRAGG